ncbi:MAG: hypothetical protein IRY87_17785 [Acetobacteraceae bacterium]|nr:hypothetical protein [Acetobacteraceae bacterium]
MTGSDESVRPLEVGHPGGSHTAWEGRTANVYIAVVMLNLNINVRHSKKKQAIYAEARPPDTPLTSVVTSEFSTNWNEDDQNSSVLVPRYWI